MVTQPSICILAPSGLMTMPMSCAATTRLTVMTPVARSTATSAGQRTVRSRILTGGNGAALSGRPGPRLPSEGIGRRLQHTAQTDVRGVAEAELQRIDLRRGGHDVDLRLAGEDVRPRAGSAPGTGCEGMHTRPTAADVGLQADVRHVVEHLGRTVA